MRYYDFKVYANGSRKYSEYKSRDYTITKHFDCVGWLDKTELFLNVYRKNMKSLRGIKMDLGDVVVFKRKKYYIMGVDESAGDDDCYFKNITCVRYPTI